MDKFAVAKGIVSMVGGCCVGGTINHLIKQNLEVEGVARISVAVGSFLIGNVVASKAEDFICDQFDEARNMFLEIKANRAKNDISKKEAE